MEPCTYIPTALLTASQTLVWCVDETSSTSSAVRVREKTNQLENQKGPNCRENGSVLVCLLILWCASWGESFSTRTLPLIIHKACRSSARISSRQMVIKSHVLFYWSLLRSCKICTLLLVPFQMVTRLIRNLPCFCFWAEWHILILH